MKRFWLAVISGAILTIGSSLSLAQVGGGDLSLKGGSAGPVRFSHAAHVDGAGLKCQQCHAKLFTNARQHKPVTMAQMRQGKSCGACHDGKTAFSVTGNCKDCHRK